MAGVTLRTIRYYDKIGLLKPSHILDNGYRQYCNKDLITLQKILALKELGFSLEEIYPLIIDNDKDSFKESLKLQTSLINQKMNHLNNLKATIKSTEKILEHDQISWEKIIELINLTNNDESIIQQYFNSQNLSTRIYLHDHFSINKESWFEWLYHQIDFSHVYQLLEIGCGNGKLWENNTYNLRNREIFLSDISEGMLEDTRKKLGNDYNYIVLDAQTKTTIDALRKDLETELDDDMESIVTDGRYTYIQKIISTTVEKPKEKLTISDKIDKIVTNRFLGIPIFLLIMYVVYYISVTTVGTFVTDWTNDVFVVAIQDAVSGFLSSVGASGLLSAVIVDGIIGGVGAVIGFAPQMAILFLFLSILEDCGYMVRIAFVMDRVFRYFGLSGKSFIPLLIGSGCGVPAIMASKTIEQDNDRRLTIMTATFIPCGAKLPVIALLGGVMAGKVAGWEAGGMIAPAMYFLGIVAVLVSAIILKKTKPFSGKPAPFVMELPEYHIPSVKTVLLHVWERLKAFLIKAGTILVVACIVIWFLSTFGFEGGSFGMVDDTANSLIAVIGNVIAPIFAPLGFGNWQSVASSLTGFSAKEAIVSTMGVLANVAGDTEDAVNVAAGVAQWFPTAMAALSFLIFNLLDSPCLAAISTMANELNDRRWFWFAIIFQNVFAYAVSLMVYQIGSLVLYGTFGFWTVVAFVVLAFMLYMLFRPDPYKDQKVYSARSVEA